MSATPKPGLLTRLAYGFGGVAFGAKDNAFAYFLLLFYSQVLGLNAQLVALALGIALVIDAILDPIVGYWSDNFRSKLGRRHPMMYAAAIPVTIAFYFVWNPPAGLSDGQLWFYLLALTVTVRVCITFYEIPSYALGAELTDDYDARTSLMGFRSFFAWIGGVTLAVIALRFFLVPTPEVSNGYFNIPGYGTYGLLAAGMIFLSIVVCTAGTHNRIKYLQQPPPQRKLTPARIFGEIFESLSDRSFLALFLATLFGYVAGGLSAALNHYLNGFFWEFTTQQVSVLTLSIYLSAPMSLIIAPLAGKLWGKRNAAIGLGAVAFTVAPAPYFLRLAGLMPENGDPALFNIMLFIIIFDVALIIAVQILTASMVADLVEQSELKTGRRSEGIFFASITFIRKVTAAMGVFIASMVLQLAKFPEGAQPGAVPDESVRTLGAIYAPVMLGVWTLMILSLFFYRISRGQHAENLRLLAERREAAAAGGAT